ncbi:MAG: HAMP domain-containing sensor histidine kinase [Myxococcaceae bacterium]|nr:HAMP domain-containing sensor histidine kinase [Myxococcaceae bacterium]
MSVVRAMATGTLVVVGLSLFDDANVISFTVLFYSPLMAGLVASAALIHRGFVSLVGWTTSLLLWATISVALVFFGGLKSNSAMAFVVAMTVAGSVVSGRAGLVVGALSGASAGIVLFLESSGRLPVPLTPTSTFNSFISVAGTLVVSGWLLTLSLRSLERALDAERAAAKERDLAHASALRAQRLESVGRLAAGVSHDLNNVLSVVQLTSEALGLEARQNERVLPLVDDLRRAADNATLLSRRMVGMSRVGGSAPEHLDVGVTMEQFAPLMRRLLPVGVTLRLEVKTKLSIFASRSALEHVLLNLVLNARDAMPHGGTIDLVVEGSELAVRDTGIGMTAEVRAKLFTPFFTTRENGNGLGLANVAELVASMGARIDVESEPGKGSTFRVSFASASTKRSEAVPAERLEQPRAPLPKLG